MEKQRVGERHRSDEPPGEHRVVQLQWTDGAGRHCGEEHHRDDSEQDVVP